MSVTSVALPEVGAPATMVVGSDRYPATVVDVLTFKTGKKAGELRAVIVQWDSYKAVGGVWPDLEYEFDRNFDGRITQINTDAKGRLRGVYIGRRDRYNDPHF